MRTNLFVFTAVLLAFSLVANAVLVTKLVSDRNLVRASEQRLQSTIEKSHELRSYHEDRAIRMQMQILELSNELDVTREQLENCADSSMGVTVRDLLPLIPHLF